jgi:Iodothyronine deiodinase
MESNVDEGVLVRQHRTLDERFVAAKDGAARLGLTMPLLVDGMDDAVSEAFGAWPERIYVARADGVLAYVGAPGPWGFDPDAARETLAEILESG